MHVETFEEALNQDHLSRRRIFCHTAITVQKIAVSLDQRIEADLDRWVIEGKYANRRGALQSAVNLLSERERRTKLARELAKLDRQEEKPMAEECLSDAVLPES